MKILSMMFLLLMFHSRVAGQTAECQTFTSSGGAPISVDNTFGGYYLIGFGTGDSPTREPLSISVSGARESPDGGSDFHLNYSLADLPSQLPTGTVNGIRFELSGATVSPSHFWVTLGSTPEACPSAAIAAVESTPIVSTATAISSSASGTTSVDQGKSSRIFTPLAITVVLLLLALIWFLSRRPSINK